MRTRYCSGNSKIDNEYHFTQTISGSRGPDFAVADARRSRTRRRDVFLHARRQALLRLGGGRLGEQRRSLQSRRGAGRAGAGGALYARDGLRRAGRDAAGGICLEARVAAARRTRKRLFRQFGSRSGRGRFEAGQAFHGPHGADLHAPRLPRLDPRFDEHDGRARRRGVERGVPSPAARRAGDRIQRFRRAGPHHEAHGLRAGRTRAGRSGRPDACAGLPGGPAAAVRRSGRPAGLRRDTDRHGTHGAIVRHAQIRRYTRYRMPGQGVRRRYAAGGVRGQARNHGYAAIRPGSGAYHHFRRTSGLLCGGAGGVELSAGQQSRGAGRSQRRAVRGTAGQTPRRARNPPQRPADGRRAG